MIPTSYGYRKSVAAAKTTTTTTVTTAADGLTLNGGSGSLQRRPTATSINRKVAALRTVILGGTALTLVHFWTSFLQGSLESQPQPQPQPQLSKSVTSAANSFWPHCTLAELDTIRHQLPPTECNATQHEPWANLCSFSYATRCPDAVWLTQYYQGIHQNVKPRSHKPSKQSPKLEAIYVGCNKAMDAVNTLRMISGNATIDRDVWRDAFFGKPTSSGSSSSSSALKFEAGRCAQEHAPQFALSPEPLSQTAGAAAAVVATARVHCIEAMPVTAAHLLKTAQSLHWDEALLVRNVAVADADGTILFPNVATQIGVENQGIENCAGQTVETETCKSVPLLRLDSYLLHEATTAQTSNKQTSKDANDDWIDFLSIDVEGFDYPVLMGAEQTLRRTKYLEFEYNWKGQWKQHALSTVIRRLQEAGFACYWSGAYGHVWRITDCWLDHYDSKFWSNVACVNRKAPNTDLSQRMEQLFRQTLAAGHKIHYGDKETANTNGGWQSSAQ
jgi:FkbM family methyltransferase